ncbi:MAG: addiction module protein [Polyangiaceae bacterium]
MARPALDISQLTPDERLDLIGELWNSLDPADVPLSDEQRAALNRRLDRLEIEGSRGSPWSDVVARIRTPR